MEYNEMSEEFTKMEILGMLETCSLDVFSKYVLKALEAKSAYESYKRNEEARRDLKNSTNDDERNMALGIFNSFMGNELSEEEYNELRKIAHKSSIIIDLVKNDSEIIDAIEYAIRSLEYDEENRASVVHSISNLVNITVKVYGDEENNKLENDSWKGIREEVAEFLEELDSVDYKIVSETTLGFKTLKIQQYNEVAARKVPEMSNFIFASFWQSTMDGFIPSGSEADKAITERKKDVGIFTTMVRKYDEETPNSKQFKIETVEQAEEQNSVEAILSLLTRPLTDEENKILQKKLETLNSYQVLQILMITATGRVPVIDNDTTVIRKSLKKLSNEECYAFAVKYHGTYTARTVVKAVYDELVRRKLFNKITVNDEEPEYYGEIKVNENDVMFLEFLDNISCPSNRILRLCERKALPQIPMESLMEEGTIVEEVEEWYESSRHNIEVYDKLIEYIEDMERSRKIDVLKEIQRTNFSLSNDTLHMDKDKIVQAMLMYLSNRIISMNSPRELGMIPFCYNPNNPTSQLNEVIDRVITDRVAIKTTGENAGSGDGR